MNKTITDKTAEIERHKYFLSEKKGYDVGWDFAETDWEQQYGDAWRSQQDSESALEEEPEPVEASVTEIHQPHESPHDGSRFRIGSLLSRFFSRN